MEEKEETRNWLLKNLQEYFDVETSIVVEKLKIASIPIKVDSVFVDHKPDLYGPLWILMTFVFTLNIVSYISHLLSQTTEFYIENFVFSVTISVFCMFIVPALIHFYLSWSGMTVERAWVISTFAYSYCNFIPAATLCIIDYEILRWIFVMLPVATGCMFLYAYVVKEKEDFKGNRKLALIAGGASQLGLAMSIQFYFL
ncbi:hypothetical protein SteCoe_28359 [Stentor coeruleus]|uniref:Protein YIPF n=1 Tax=Stentor coeruleus TaxID=5963 RepID=A0A1R2B8I4_9CILI|nr:hypothetical protein SteCoe_28359 [Stentor coeruleus]